MKGNSVYTPSHMQHIDLEIDDLLVENPAAFPALSLTRELAVRFDQHAWENYEEETGNKRYLKYNEIESCAQKVIEENEYNFKRFTVWVIKGFINMENAKDRLIKNPLDEERENK